MKTKTKAEATANENYITACGFFNLVFGSL